MNKYVNKVNNTMQDIAQLLHKPNNCCSNYLLFMNLSLGQMKLRFLSSRIRTSASRRFEGQAWLFRRCSRVLRANVFI